jgi:hypothetical protein
VGPRRQRLEREGVGTDSEKEGRWPWAGSWRGPERCPAAFLPFFLFPIRFLFCFSFVIFAKHFQNDFKQLLKLAIRFPSVC